jgi:hypothetical protein
MPASRRRLGLVGGAGTLLGTPVTAAVPLQRHQPALMLVASLAEVAALVALVATASLAALAFLVALSIILVVGLFTNTRRVIALTDKGNVILSASLSGWPNGVVGPGPHHLDLPEPHGVGVAVKLEQATWWVDRSSFRFLRRALAVQAATGDESPG